MKCAVSVVGIGDDGCKGLTARAMDAVANAQWLVGGERQLAFFPQFHGERIVLQDGLGKALDRVARIAEEHNVCVLASGDPLFFGIGSLVVKKIGAEHVSIIPQPSAVAWAFAKVGLRADDATVLSLHGQPRVLATRLQALRKVAVLTDPTNTPQAIALHLMERNAGAWQAWVCESLCGPNERVQAFASLEALAAAAPVDPLNVLLLQRPAGWEAPPVMPFQHEDAFIKRVPKKGLITKREVRVLSLAALQIQPTAVVWDIGAGSGAVAIEAAMLARQGQVFAIEVDPEGCLICRENSQSHGVDNVQVIEGRAPQALQGLPAPDAVFVGGSKGSMADIVSAALTALKPGGRLVANAITLENAAEAYQALRAHGLQPEVTLLQVSRGAPLAHYTRYEALNPIQIFAVTKACP